MNAATPRRGGATHPSEYPANNHTVNRVTIALRSGRAVGPVGQGEQKHTHTHTHPHRHSRAGGRTGLRPYVSTPRVPSGTPRAHGQTQTGGRAGADGSTPRR